MAFMVLFSWFLLVHFIVTVKTLLLDFQLTGWMFLSVSTALKECLT